MYAFLRPWMSQNIGKKVQVLATSTCQPINSYLDWLGLGPADPLDFNTLPCPTYIHWSPLDSTGVTGIHWNPLESPAKKCFFLSFSSGIPLDSTGSLVDSSGLQWNNMLQLKITIVINSSGLPLESTGVHWNNMLQLQVTTVITFSRLPLESTGIY